MKQKIILTAKHGRPSTQLVYSTMSSGMLIQRRQLFSKKRILLRQYYRKFINNAVDILYKIPQLDVTNSIVVRWGTREELQTDNTTIVYNQSKAIANATDKKLSRQLFIENGVSTPKLMTLDNFETSDLPIIARPLVHSKGKNFVVLNNFSDFERHYNQNNQGWYYSQFINKEREFRVHCGHGKVLVLMEKSNPNNGNLAWNRAQNDTEPFTYIPWTQIDDENLKCVLEEGLKATVAVGLDMSGVDVMLYNGQAYVLEVNTAPTLNTSPYVAERWGKYFDWLFRQDTRRDHWDISGLKKASSLVWKGFQLQDRPNPKQS
jgi:glutathione synthase/RimK-type ligase-like ATP-grasp enzyme